MSVEALILKCVRECCARSSWAMDGPTTANQHDLNTGVFVASCCHLLSLFTEPGTAEVDEGPPETEPSFRI